jgi:hypothetical protein
LEFFKGKQQDIYQIRIKLGHNPDMCLHMAALQFHGDRQKQTLTTTSSNHVELIALYDAGRECVWLRSMIQHIQEEYGLESVRENSTVIYEDNTACITQIKEGYIKDDRTKHISPKFFSTHYS